MLAMMVAIGVVISPILRIEGMCPTAHLINIVCSVLLGPWYSLLCATLIGIIRMMFMGIPPLALTGAVFGAFLSGVFYRASHGKIICAVIGEIFGTGIIGSLVSYPVMAFLMGRSGLNAFFYTPMFLAATCMGGTIAYFFLKALSHAGMLAKFQQSLGAKVYDRKSDKSQTIDQSSTAADSLLSLIHISHLRQNTVISMNLCFYHSQQFIKKRIHMRRVGPCHQNIYIAGFLLCSIDSGFQPSGSFIWHIV